MAYLGKRVDGGEEELACVLYFLAVQLSIEEPNPQRLAHPLVCILASQDVLILHTHPIPRQDYAANAKIMLTWHKMHRAQHVLVLTLPAMPNR